MLKTNFSGHNTYWWGTKNIYGIASKNIRGTASNASGGYDPAQKWGIKKLNKTHVTHHVHLRADFRVQWRWRSSSVVHVFTVSRTNVINYVVLPLEPKNAVVGLYRCNWCTPCAFLYSPKIKFMSSRNRMVWSCSCWS